MRWYVTIFINSILSSACKTTLRIQLDSHGGSGNPSVLVKNMFSYNTIIYIRNGERLGK